MFFFGNLCLFYFPLQTHFTSFLNNSLYFCFVFFRTIFFQFSLRFFALLSCFFFQWIIWFFSVCFYTSHNFFFRIWFPPFQTFFSYFFCYTTPRSFLAHKKEIGAFFPLEGFILFFVTIIMVIEGCGGLPHFIPQILLVGFFFSLLHLWLHKNYVVFLLFVGNIFVAFHLHFLHTFLVLFFFLMC